MLRHPDHTSGVVLPMDARSGEHHAPTNGAPTNGAATRGPVMVVGWWAEPAASARFWGDVLPAGSELAHHLGRVAARRTQERPTLDGGLTFRLSLSEAFGAEQLLHLADGSPRRTDPPGRGVLVPLSGLRQTSPVPGAPLGLMAQTLLVEIATTDVQNRVLTDLTAAVHDLAPSAPTRLDARLRAAEETLRTAQTALLTSGAVPTDVALGTASANLSVLRHQTVAHLAGWERVVEGLDPSGAHGTAVREALGEVGRLGWTGFPGAVHAAYQGLVLDARRLLVVAAEQHLRSPERSLTALRPLVEADVAARVADVVRLRKLLARLSVVPLTVRKRSGAMLPNLIADQAADNARTQALFTRMATALTPVPGQAAYDVEIQTRASGDLQVLRPAP
ncbi:hypothetical protein EV383_4276 [Pseudonocardia sediminis]|uniref:Uncharacterized protein n=1 Tax=Pseudonocardia sediminis TaxID=1397368 RepID=A0A4Q7UZE2_PSEST|nr:hypothetical protein [Pseudonocardia sediminis]RZT87356.1 hypothetical protein EV383_4276 [Pseudonocardia sediminis]